MVECEQHEWSPIKTPEGRKISSVNTRSHNENTDSLLCSVSLPLCACVCVSVIPGVGQITDQLVVTRSLGILPLSPSWRPSSVSPPLCLKRHMTSCPEITLGCQRALQSLSQSESGERGRFVDSTVTGSRPFKALSVNGFHGEMQRLAL